MHTTLFDYFSQFMPLTDQEKEAIISSNVFRIIQKGTILLKEGQYSDQDYFVLKGLIRKYYQVEGEEKTTAFFMEMEGITPHCVSSQRPSEYYIEAVEDSIISISNPELEKQMFEKFPRFETLCRIFSEHLLAKKQIEFDEFKTNSPEKRYINLLKNRPELLQRVPQHQLASYLGIQPQSLSRLRARLVQKEKLAS